MRRPSPAVPAVPAVLVLLAAAGALSTPAARGLAAAGVRVMKISVIAGNDDAVRFYQREGAVGFVSTLIMPVSDAGQTPAPAVVAPEA